MMTMKRYTHGYVLLKCVGRNFIVYIWTIIRPSKNSPGSLVPSGGLFNSSGPTFTAVEPRGHPPEINLNGKRNC
jgi:hypothetical protein